MQALLMHSETSSQVEPFLSGSVVPIFWDYEELFDGGTLFVLEKGREQVLLTGFHDDGVYLAALFEGRAPKGFKKTIETRAYCRFGEKISRDYQAMWDYVARRSEHLNAQNAGSGRPMVLAHWHKRVGELTSLLSETELQGIVDQIGYWQAGLFELRAKRVYGALKNNPDILLTKLLSAVKKQAGSQGKDVMAAYGALLDVSALHIAPPTFLLAAHELLQYVRENGGHTRLRSLLGLDYFSLRNTALTVGEVVVRSYRTDLFKKALSNLQRWKQPVDLDSKLNPPLYKPFGVP